MQPRLTQKIAVVDAAVVDAAVVDAAADGDVAARCEVHQTMGIVGIYKLKSESSVNIKFDSPCPLQQPAHA